MKKKGFTLIELIGVLVILAILALIVTPLVMNIIKKTRISADKRSIDVYGRSIELAIATYLLDEGKFPTSIDELSIEYTGDEVVCTTTQLNSDLSIYLADCTVSGRRVYGYRYGKEETEPTYTVYSIGDEVTYNNVNYYVIKESGAKEQEVTLLKAEPLTIDEVNEYGAGHLNRYTFDSVGNAYDCNGYGGMAYYTSETCGKVNGFSVYTGCSTDYASSEVKYAVDKWKTVQAPAAIEARLITREELTNDLGCVKSSCTNSSNSWLYNSKHLYWTMSPYNNSASDGWYVNGDGSLYSIGVYNSNTVVRPVITISKSDL